MSGGVDSAMHTMLKLAAARLAQLSGELSEAITSQNCDIGPKSDEIGRLWTTLQPALKMFVAKTREAKQEPSPGLPFGFSDRANVTSEEELIRRGIILPDRAPLGSGAT
jgi:hypothetical protein